MGTPASGTQRLFTSNSRALMRNSVTFHSYVSPPSAPASTYSDYFGDKRCKDCVHFLGDRLSGKCGIFPFITNVKNNKHFVLDVDIDYEDCVDAREDESKCGASGNYFEEDF